MAKIRNWVRLPDKEYPFLGAPKWKNSRTGHILVVDRVEGGGAIVYITKKNGDVTNALHRGMGFRTKALALKWASNYRRRNA